MKDGGCCVARFNGDIGGNGGAGAGGAPSTSPSPAEVDRIMLRFRPIAPKPCNPSRPEYAPAPAPARGKRRGGVIRDASSAKALTRSRSRRKVSDVAVAAPVTLPLLPEAPEVKGSSDRDSSPSSTLDQVADSWPQAAVAAPPAVAAQALLTVERVVMGALPLPQYVEDCPTFVTDQWYSVLGYNDGFWKMICGDGVCHGNDRVLVALMPKEKLPGPEVQAFTCRVRVQVAFGAKERPSSTVPCDVWRMEGPAGGWTWRLDIKAALSLGR